jgi:hypothetical protein
MKEMDARNIFTDLYKYYVERYISSLMAVAVLSFIAYGFVMFNHTLIGDEWWAFQGTNPDWVVRVGRWMHRIVWVVLGDNYLAPAFTIFFMLTFWWAGLLIVLNTLEVKSTFNAFVFLALFTFSPFWAETVHFKMNHGSIGLGVFFSLTSGCLAWRAAHNFAMGGLSRRVLWYGIASAVLFSLGVSCRQETAPIGPAVFLIVWLRTLYVEPQNQISWPVLSRYFVSFAGVFFVGIVLYWIEVRLSFWLFDLKEMEYGNYQLTTSLVKSAAEVNFVLERLFSYLYQFLFESQYLVPIVAKWLFWASLLINVNIIFYCLKTLPSNAERMGFFCLTGLLITGLVLLPWALGVLRVPNSYRYGGISSLAMVFAGFYLLAVDCQRWSVMRTLAQCLAVILILIFVFQHNAASLVTNNLNRRDWALTERLVAHVERLENFDQVTEGGTGRVQVLVAGRPNVLRGRPFSMPRTGKPMQSSVIECGIFDCHLGRLPTAMNVVQVHSVEYAIVKMDWLATGEQKDLRAALEDMDVWPSEDSIRLLPNRILIVRF